MTIDLVAPLIAGLGTTELIIILAVVVLLFGAAKLPELARNSGRALRIFKSETKGLMSDDTTPEQREIEARDERDASRKVAPLKPALGALIVDTTGMPVQDVVAKVLAVVRKSG